jgi:CheY-like chemotaxis protein
MEATQNKKILVVEDEEDARIIFVDILSSLGYDVLSADDGTTALQQLESHKFDLVLLDIVMPKMDGIQTLKEIKRFPGKYGDMNIVMLTNIGGDAMIEEALKIGARGYMLKSETEPGDLLAVIQKYLEL